MRVPSALCGVVGLRPTVGRTSTAHCPDNAFSIMAFGAHTGCIADAVLLHAAIANAGAPALLAASPTLPELAHNVQAAEAIFSRNQLCLQKDAIRVLVHGKSLVLASSRCHALHHLLPGMLC